MQFVICFGTEGHRLMSNYRDTYQKMDGASQSLGKQWIESNTHRQRGSEGLNTRHYKIMVERKKMALFRRFLRNIIEDYR